MIYKLIEDEQGQYVGTDGKRYTLLEAVEFIDTPEGRDIDCVYLQNTEEAMEYFGVQYAQESPEANNNSTNMY